MTFSVDRIMPHSEMKEFKKIEEIIMDLKNKEDRPLFFNEEEIEIARDFFSTTNYFSFAIYRKMLPMSLPVIKYPITPF